MKKRFIGLLLLVFFFYLFGQNQQAFAQHSEQPAVDSLIEKMGNNNSERAKVDLLAQLTWQLRKQYPDSANQYALQGIKLASQINYLPGKAEIYKNLGSRFYNHAQ